MNAPPGEVPSPCVKVCTMDPVRGVCAGCYRTLEEIAGWPKYPAWQKLAVWQRIKERSIRWGPPQRSE
ncbi:MAG TPA: DUF1289 domain-containing protein [Burkholderiales bacterium]